MRVAIVVLTFIALTLAVPASARAADRVDVLVPEAENLQLMAFWVGLGADLFAAEGLDVHVTSPPRPRDALEPVRSGAADVALLPPPLWLDLIAEGAKVQLFANLLANDPINIVVRRSVLAQRNVPRTGPIRDRLAALKGLRIGIAPGPPPRLRALYAAYGLDADKELQLVTLGGKEQNPAFEDGRVDALFAHTPYLETALVDQDAVLVVNLSSGEVAELADVEIHSLVISKRFAETRRGAVDAMVRALAKAEALMKTDVSAATTAIAKQFPSRNRKHLEAIVPMYCAAAPKSPEVTAERMRKASRLYPSSKPPGTFDAFDFAPFIGAAPIVATTQASPPSGSSRLVLAACGAGAAAAILAIAIVLRRRRARRRN